MRNRLAALTDWSWRSANSQADLKPQIVSRSGPSETPSGVLGARGRADQRKEPRCADGEREGCVFKVVDPNSSVYDELSASGVTHIAEFPPAEERAFVVGSTDRASLRVSSVGVAPVQFHLEREDATIWLIPACGIADLSVRECAQPDGRGV